MKRGKEGKEGEAGREGWKDGRGGSGGRGEGRKNNQTVACMHLKVGIFAHYHCLV